MGIPPQVSVTILILLALVILVGMWRGWRGRTRRSAALVTTLPQAPAQLGAPRTGPLAATYVSTTTAGDWLDRVATLDLGVRSKAEAQVFDAGLVIARTGATDLFVPATAITGTRLAPGMAGKFVGGEGLVVVTWTVVEPVSPGERRSRTGDTPLALDTGLRLAHQADRDILTRALDALTSTTPTQPEEQQ